MDKKNVFKVLDETGKEIECEMLFTFDSDETGKNYIIYTDNSLDEEGNTRVYASIFDPTKEQTVLEPIQTEKEWKIIETILESLQKREDERASVGTEGNEQ